MRINLTRKSIDVEVRDINYILGAFVINYLFVSKNEVPEEIIVPKCHTVPHPRQPGVMIPIRWLEPDDSMIAEITQDGSNIPEVTPEKEAELDAKDTLAKEAKEQVEEVKEVGIVEEDARQGEGVKVQGTSPAKEALERAKAPQERVPKLPPGGDIGSGHPDDLGSRDIRADKRIVADLKGDAKVDEDKELDTDIKKL